MDTFRTIIVPLDGSKPAEAAIPTAAALAAAYDATITFLHVAPTAEDAHTASESFTRYAHKLRDANGLGAVDARVVPGSADAGIVREAAGGLIVLASHGRAGWHSVFIGSVADKVVRSANVPVVVVPVLGHIAPPDRAHPVVVGVDGSTTAELSLSNARELCRRTGARLHLVTAYEPLAPAIIDMVFYPVDLTNDLKEPSRAYVESVAQPGEATLVQRGPAHRVLGDVAERLDAGIIVVGNEGLGLARRVAIGSTTDRLLHGLRRPLLIIPSQRQSQAHS